MEGGQGIFPLALLNIWLSSLGFIFLCMESTVLFLLLLFSLMRLFFWNRFGGTSFTSFFYSILCWSGFKPLWSVLFFSLPFGQFYLGFQSFRLVDPVFFSSWISAFFQMLHGLAYMYGSSLSTDLHIWRFWAVCDITVMGVQVMTLFSVAFFILPLVWNGLAILLNFLSFCHSSSVSVPVVMSCYFYSGSLWRALSYLILLLPVVHYCWRPSSLLFGWMFFHL